MKLINFILNYFNLVIYRSGQFLVLINFENGTKIRIESILLNYIQKYFPILVIPESCDTKITDYCDAGCAYCHENSTKKGKHSDLNQLLNLTMNLPKGCELAIGGGNPLSHPDLIRVLRILKSRGIICNLTMNQFHIRDVVYRSLLKYLLHEKLIHGLGISVNDDIVKNHSHYIREYYKNSKSVYNTENEKLTNLDLDFSYLQELQDVSPNVVYHMINGVNDIHSIQKLPSNKKTKTLKVLVLGYKTFGRGEKFKIINSELNDSFYIWKTMLSWYLRYDKKTNPYVQIENCKDIIMSFDNLSLDQLNLKRFFTEKEFSRYFMGDDGSHTFFMDIVENQYCKSSTTPKLERYSFNNNSCMIELFQNVKIN